MAQLTGPNQAFHADTSVVDTAQRATLGTRGYDPTGNVYIYLQGVGSTTAGNWVTYDESFVTTLLGAAAVGPVAIAMAAINATTSYGWYQISGVNTIAKSDTVAADKQLYIDGTSGQVDDLSVSGDLVVGAVSQAASVAGVVTVAINFPYVSATLGGAGAGDVVGPASSTDLAVVKFSGTTGKLVQNSGILLDGTNVLYPATSDAGTLGSTTKMWSDLFLALGAVVNFNNGDITLTHSAAKLTLAGGPLVVPVNGLTINATNVTSTGTQLNFLNAATGTTGTTSTNLVFSTSPTFITPTLGAATATSINNLTITSSTGTLTITNGKTISFSASLTFAGTDSTTMTFPSTSATIARTDAGQTFTGTHIFTSPKIITSILDTNGNIQLSMIATASAVNYVEFTNAATGTAGPIIAAQGETNVDLKIAAKGTGGVHITTGSYGDYTADTDGATITFNLATSNVHSVTLGGNRTLALSNAKAGQIFTIRLLQDGTGSRTVTWFTTITWAGAAAPTLTTTASRADTFVFLAKTTTTFDGYIVGQNIG